MTPLVALVCLAASIPPSFDAEQMPSCIVVRGEWHNKIKNALSQTPQEVIALCDDNQLQKYVFDGSMVYIDPFATGLAEITTKLDLLTAAVAQISDKPYFDFASMSDADKTAFRKLITHNDQSILSRYVTSSDQFNVFASPVTILKIEYDGVEYELNVSDRMLDHTPFAEGAVVPDADTLDNAPPMANPRPVDNSAVFLFPGQIQPSHKAILTQLIADQVATEMESAMIRYNAVIEKAQKKLASVLPDSGNANLGLERYTIGSLSEALRNKLSPPSGLGLPASIARDPDFLSKIRIISAKPGVEIGVELLLSQMESEGTTQKFYGSRSVLIKG